MQTAIGIKKAMKTIYKRYGDDHFVKMGTLGGNAPHSKPRGFATFDKQKHLELSARGGRISRRLKPNA